jgi:hypothetical protein
MVASPLALPSPPKNKSPLVGLPPEVWGPLLNVNESVPMPVNVAKSAVAIGSTVVDGVGVPGKSVGRRLGGELGAIVPAKGPAVAEAVALYKSGPVNPAFNSESRLHKCHRRR